MDYTQTILPELVAVHPHYLSKQIPSFCWLRLTWEACCLTRINSMHVKLFSGKNSVAGIVTIMCTIFGENVLL